MQPNREIARHFRDQPSSKLAIRQILMADPIDGHHQPTWNFKVIIKVVEKNRFHLILVHIFIIIVFRWTHRSFRTATLKPKILTSLYSSYSLMTTFDTHQNVLFSLSSNSTVALFNRFELSHLFFRVIVIDFSK